MSAFIKTLVGDAWNVSVVGVLVAAAAALTYLGHTAAVPFVIPPMALCGVAWLAKR